ncbi:MAG TPA: hypothetical protein VMX56_06165 [Anaerolineales bacterium]|nr:hypothetical protein [Anaerolineales bacterium]
MTLYSSGIGLTTEIGDRFAWKERVVHDFEFQTNVLFNNNPMVIFCDCTLVAICGKVKTAPTGCDAIFNLRRFDIQLFAGDDRPKMPLGTRTLWKTGISIALFAGEYVTWEDIQKGSTIAGGYGQFMLVFK